VLALACRPGSAEEVLRLFEAGERPSVARIKAVLAGLDEGAECEDAEEAGGVRGLEQLHAAKRFRLRDLAERLEGILGAVEGALAPAADGGRVLKGALAEAIVIPARHARLELLNLCAFLVPSP